MSPIPWIENFTLFDSIAKGGAVMRLRIPLLLITALLLGGCAEAFLSACLEIATDQQKEFKYSEAKAAVVCEKAQLVAVPSLTPYNKKKERYELNRNGILVADVEKVLGDQANQLDDFLSYELRRTADRVDYWRGFRESLEREEKVVLAYLERLSLARTYDEFVEAVGEMPGSEVSEEQRALFPDGRKYYSLKLLYPYTSLRPLHFTAPYLEAAKQSGTLRLIEEFEWGEAVEFGQKVPDLYDPNAFGWKGRYRGYLVRAYKIWNGDGNVPADGTVHYIEVYRQDPRTKQVEEAAVARGFLAAGGQKVTVFVLDTNKVGTDGYGYPDQVVTIHSGVATAREIFFLSGFREKILDPLYADSKTAPRERRERQKPTDREPYIAITKVGDVTVEIWERGVWKVPFDYRSASTSQKIEIKTATIVDPDEARRAEREKVSKIEGLSIRYSRDGAAVVIEYRKPKEAYAGLDIANSIAFTDTLRVRRKNGPEETGEIGYFALPPHKIEYKYGDRWYAIVDEDGDGVFEKRREIGDRSAESNQQASHHDGM